MSGNDPAKLYNFLVGALNAVTAAEARRQQAQTAQGSQQAQGAPAPGIGGLQLTQGSGASYGFLPVQPATMPHNPVPYIGSARESERLDRVEAQVRILHKGQQSSNKTIDLMAKVLNVKPVEFKPHSAVFAKDVGPTKVLTNAPSYQIRTQAGHDAYTEALKTYATLDGAEIAALAEAEEADEDELAKNAPQAAISSGGAGGSAPTKEQRLEMFANLHSKAIAANDVNSLHAMIDNLAAIASTDKNTAMKKGKLIKIFKKNKEDYGFGICEFVQNPFAPIDQAEVDQFEDFKKHFGFPAGKWDGRLDPI